MGKGMNNMISIIVPDCNDRTYLIRCLNALRRQTYQDIELLLVGTEYSNELLQEYHAICKPDLSAAVSAATGERILFCSMTSVLAVNVLEELSSGSKESGAWLSARCMVPDGSNFKAADDAGLSLYGKLFEKEKTLAVLAALPDNAAWTNIFVLSYLSAFEKVEISETCFLYETVEQAVELSLPQNMSESELRSWFAQTTRLTDADRHSLTRQWVALAAPEEAFFRVLMAAKCFPEDKALNYSLASAYIKNAYCSALAEQNEPLYDGVKEYFEIFNSEGAYQTVLCRLCEICEEQLDCMLRYGLKDYLFYYDRIPCQNTWLKKMNEAEELCRRAAERAQKLEEQLSGSIGADDQTMTRTVLDALRGPALAECMIGQYRKGRLGAMTILKSSIAWLKFKIKKD